MKKEEDYAEIMFLNTRFQCSLCTLKWSQNGSPSVDILIWKDPDKEILFKMYLYFDKYKIEFINGEREKFTEFYITSNSEESYNGYEHYLTVEEDIEFDVSNVEELMKQISFYITYG